MLEAESHRGIPGRCLGCETAVAQFRCRECSDCLPLCLPCLLAVHRHAPYHWVEEWTGRYFVRRDLSSLGFIRYLGHDGDICPTIASHDRALKPRKMVITHVNGIHQCLVVPCECYPPVELLDQLLLAELFPATLIAPDTAFTFEVLADCHLDFLTSKKSTYDYVRKLQRRTDNSCASGVTDRYREFLWASRMWRIIVTPCFTCPRPGVNLPPDWQNVPPKLSYIYRIFLGADGNHSLQKKSKKDDPTDYSLGRHVGFFNDASKLHGYNHAADARDNPEKVVETCSGFKVTRSQKPGKFRYLDVTGVVAVTCIRHGCVQCQGLVDMLAGERFMLLDLALSGALESARALHEFLLTYDVGCSYVKNLLARWDKYKLPPHLRDIIQKMKVLLPQMHMLAHKDSCQTEYAVCYTLGAGHSNGESVEILWAVHNLAGLSTREMNGGGRHDALNDLFSFWNWTKNENMGKYLSRKLKEKLPLQLDQLVDFVKLSSRAGPALCWQWAQRLTDIDAPNACNHAQRAKERPRRVFRLDDSKVPSAGKAYKELMTTATTLKARHMNRVAGVRADGRRSAAGSELVKSTELQESHMRFLMKGVELQEEQ
ncbi:hypothetical protein C8Q76DRAFT_633263 [Earliella scabrosa]|nr:hypothetical protein C8Q76DRAFT_633263 [Earliella scabrosa]